MAEPTTSKDRIPRQGSESFDCPRCGVYAHQEWFDLKRETYTNDNWNNGVESVNAVDSGVLDPMTGSQDTWFEEDGAIVAHQVGQWRMAKCWKCKEYSTWRDDELIFPAGSSYAPQPHEDMPEDAKTLYREAAAVVGISPRAGTALARATLELLLKSLDPMEGSQNLAKRIDHVLVDVGTKTPLGRMLTVIRHSGNKSLHVEEQPDAIMVQILDPEDPGVLALIFESINDLVEQLHTRPQRVEALFESVPKGVRDQVGRPPKPPRSTTA
jgi:hypothetical protein